MVEDTQLEYLTEQEILESEYHEMVLEACREDNERLIKHNQALVKRVDALVEQRNRWVATSLILGVVIGVGGLM